MPKVLQKIIIFPFRMCPCLPSCETVFNLLMNSLMFYPFSFVHDYIVFRLEVMTTDCTHFELKHCNLQGHSSLAPIYLAHSQNELCNLQGYGKIKLCNLQGHSSLIHIHLYAQNEL